MLARLRNGFYLAPGLLALLGCLPAQAQEAYPSRAITLIVPYETGGSIDAAARVIQPALEKQLGQKVIIENRGGGVGIIGTELGINAEPDGYTLMFQAVSSAVINGITNKENVKTDLKTMVPITQIATSPRMVIISKDLGVHTVNDFVNLLKANPGKYKFGSNGETAVLGGAMFMVRTGTKMVNIPYTGGTEVRVALVANEVQMRVGNPGPDIPFIRSGESVGLCVAGLKRSTLAPEVPTCEEGGIKDFVQSSWVGIFGPPGTPDDVAKKVSEAVQEAVKDPEVVRLYATQGNEIVASTPSEFKTFWEHEFVTWQEAYDVSGLKK